MHSNLQQKNEVLQQIQRLQEELSELALARERLKKQSFVCKLVRSPFRRLPEDIIYHIIKQCPYNYPEDALVFSPRTHVPTSLAQVSSIWRTSVFRQSSLWRKISIDSSHWKAKPLEVERRLDLFTTLSVPGGGISLDLLSRYDDDDVQQEADLHSALDWILHTWPRSHSIKQLNLGLALPAAVVKLLQNASPRQWSFQTLQFMIPYRYADVSNETVTWGALTSMLHRLPHVQHFGISYSGSWRLSDITDWINGTQASSNPWSQLTTLSLDDALMFSKLKDLRVYLEDEVVEGDRSNPSLNSVPTVTTVSIALDFRLLYNFVDLLQANDGAFTRLAHLSLSFRGSSTCLWKDNKDKENKRKISGLLLDIRRWYSKVTANRGDGMHSKNRASMKIQFAWHERLDEPEIEEFRFDTRELAEILQELCALEEGIPIDVECVGNGSTNYDSLYGLDLFRQLYFS
ncbi:hypothetical protein CVT24_001663 [Panaeolus cyanescens]|uniref:F-box domain-containing protein n=1 Tax=Panaeolus cyanescens TaxID=181874 RepID=A0A409VT02_9AGAR|nr:hypothetical protein CVT24_001663 [Panaeolus cyanescens]